MAFTHIQINPSLTPANRIRNAILGIKANRDALTDEIATMVTMIDGDTSNAANYGEVVTRYGVEGGNTAAKALFDEANSLNAKLTTDASVSSVSAAIAQAANKVR